MRSTIKCQSYTIISHDPVDIKPCSAEPESNVGEPNKDAVDEKKYQQKTQNISCQCSEVEVEKINVHSQYDDTVAERVTASDNQITPRNTICQVMTGVSECPVKLCRYCQPKLDVYNIDLGI